jgi:hypothetical protein
MPRIQVIVSEVNRGSATALASVPAVNARFSLKREMNGGQPKWRVLPGGRTVVTADNKATLHVAPNVWGQIVQAAEEAYAEAGV